MDRKADQNSRSKVSPKAVAAGVLVVLLLVFIFENTTRTKIRFIGPRVTTSLWVALLVAVLLGGIVGWLIGRRRD